MVYSINFLDFFYYISRCSSSPNRSLSSNTFIDDFINPADVPAVLLDSQALLYLISLLQWMIK